MFYNLTKIVNNNLIQCKIMKE